MELIQVAQQLYQTSLRLDKAPKEINKQARAYAEAERTYRQALSAEIIRLKSEGMAASIIGDVARGNVAELKYERDLAQGLYKSAIESKRALEAELSALQSLNKNHSEVGG